MCVHVCVCVSVHRYLLSIFTFIAKCTGVKETDFETIITEAGLCPVVYNTTLPPSQIAAQAAANEEAAAAARGGRGARGAGSRGRVAPKRSVSRPSLAPTPGRSVPLESKMSSHASKEQPAPIQESSGVSGAAGVVEGSAGATPAPLEAAHSTEGGDSVTEQTVQSTFVAQDLEGAI